MSTATASAVGSERALLVDIDVADSRWDQLASFDVARFSQDIDAALTVAVELGELELVAPAEVSVRLTNDRDVRALNSHHRHLDTATDVLSFPLYPDAYPGPRGPLLGDLVLAYETCMADADALQIAPHHHVIHLCVHGFLHLFGYDHEEDEAGEKMETLEVRILERLAIANPYAAAT